MIPEYLLSFGAKMNMFWNAPPSRSGRDGQPGIKKYRAKRKIRNKIAKLSRRANR